MDWSILPGWAPRTCIGGWLPWLVVSPVRIGLRDPFQRAMKMAYTWGDPNHWTKSWEPILQAFTISTTKTPQLPSTWFKVWPFWGMVVGDLSRGWWPPCSSILPCSFRVCVVKALKALKGHCPATAMVAGATGICSHCWSEFISRLEVQHKIYHLVIQHDLTNTFLLLTL